MILITGGSWQGKKKFAFTLAEENRKAVRWEDGPDEAFSAHIVCGVHFYISQLLREGKDPLVFARELIQKNPNVIITTDEVGCGVVPTGTEERVWRETVGRISCFMAERANEVYRVVCGIPVKLK